MSMKVGSMGVGRFPISQKEITNMEDGHFGNIFPRLLYAILEL